MKSFNSYWIKFKCLFGSHEWSYHTEDVTIKIESSNSMHKSSYVSKVNTRFCNQCYKKQIRERNDMNIYYVEDLIYNLTDEQRRIKNLNELIDGKN
jgi:hypothetical protein